MVQITKEKGIKDFLANTTVDTINNKVVIKYLYEEEKLLKLDENFYGATRRVTVLHNKIFVKSDVATGMDQYIHEQVENGNYVEIDPSEACLNNHQLCFVGYNFVVSSTSSSTKVRMTSDSSIRTDSSLSLSEVTKPADGDVPSLQGILLRLRCHVFYSVFYIKKFFQNFRQRLLSQNCLCPFTVLLHQTLTQPFLDTLQGQSYSLRR